MLALENIEWLASNYEMTYGLRGERWIWSTIIKGIITEHIRYEK